MTFGIGTFDAGEGSFPGLVVDDMVVDLRAEFGPQATTAALFERWDDDRPRLHRVAGRGGAGRPRLAEVRALPPVRPAQVLCAGANYARHVRQIVFSTLRGRQDGRSDEELHAAADEAVRSRTAAREPFLFAALSSALTGARDDVVLWGPGVQHDWELELAVVIGRRAHRVPRAAAMDHVAGYTICNDISTRDVMNRPDLPMTDFVMTKSRPTFFPTGPYVVPAEFVPDPRALRIRLAVNGETMQDESVDDIIHGVDELVSHASRMAVLLPGDLLLTGSPAGNAGHHGGRWLTPGDVLEGEITGLGRQRNTCVAPPAGD